MTADRIGIIRWCGLGDVVQLTPLLQQIRADKPQARIEVFINAGAAPVLEGCPWVDAVHALSENDMRDETGGMLMWRMWGHVWRAGRFSVLLHLDLRWQRSALLRWMRADRKIAFVAPGRKPWRAADLLLTVPVAFSENARHSSLWYLDLWRAAAGGEDRGFGYDVKYLLGHEQAENKTPRRVALVPGASQSSALGAVKRWPVAHWRALAEKFLAAGWSPVFVGTTTDFPAAEIPDGAENFLMRPEPAAVRRAARMMADCAGVIGNDTGLYQIALGLGVPSVGLFGATSPLRTGPLCETKAITLTHLLPCAPCYQGKCTRDGTLHPGEEPPFCLSLLTPSRVFDAAEKLFSQSASPVATTSISS